MNPQFLAIMTNNLAYTEETFEAITYTHDYWIFLAPLLSSAVDIITGWIQATINSRWESTKMRYGIMRKAGMFLIIVVAYCFEYAIDAVRMTHVATAVSGYIVFMELLSILENLDQAGVPVPKFLRNRLKKVQEHLNDLDKEEQGKEE